MVLSPKQKTWPGRTVTSSWEFRKLEVLCVIASRRDFCWAQRPFWEPSVGAHAALVGIISRDAGNKAAQDTLHSKQNKPKACIPKKNELCA